MEKVELLKKIYFDPSGYQSKQNLYKEAINYINKRFNLNVKLK